MASKMFFGGMPTGPDVRKLIAAFGKPTPGTEITHEEIEAVLSITRKESRYSVVTLAWRKQLLKDDSIDIGAVNGIGFRALIDSERVSNGVSGVQQGARKQMRSIKRATMLETANPELQKKQELLTRYGIALQGEVNTMLKQIAAPKPAEQMPRLVRTGA